MSTPSPRKNSSRTRSPAGARKRRAGERRPVGREPSQERGQRRVNAILDATAEILVEEGSGGVTMHRVARRSGTTTGSMYHFFPDRDALLRALADRHVAALRELLQRMERDAAPRWKSGTTQEAVDGFLKPVLNYVDAHPSLSAISRYAVTADWGHGSRRDDMLDELFIRLGRSLIRSRTEAGSEAELYVRSVAVVGMLEGIFRAGEHVFESTRRTVSRAALRQELRNALIAYLDSL